MRHFARGFRRRSGGPVLQAAVQELKLRLGRQRQPVHRGKRPTHQRAHLLRGAGDFLIDDHRRHKAEAAGVAQASKCARWKLEIAQPVGKAAGAPYRWIAERLVMGSPASVRVAVCTLTNMKQADPVGLTSPKTA